MDSNSSLGFDLNSQKGVAVLLASLRASDLTGAQKNEIRDLIFSYTNGGGDVSIKIALEQKLRAHNIKPVSPVGGAQTSAAKIAPTPVLPFGSSRPSPVFKVPVFSNANSKPSPAPTEQKTAPEIKKAEPAPVVEKKNEEVKIPTPTPTPQSRPEPKPAATKVEVKPVVNGSSVANSNDYIDRIREIKSAVNSKVGNPVNLVDIDNEVGREYMNALLEAMKRLSGGASGQMEAAMKRLETAFSAVEKAVEGHKPKADVPQVEPARPITPAPAPTHTQAPAPKPTAPEVDTSPVLGSNFASAPKPPSIPTPTAPASKPLPPPPPPPQTQPKTEQKKTDSESNPWQAARETVAAAAVATPPPVKPVAQAQSQAQTYQAKSILGEDRLATPADLPLKHASDTSDSTDPLYSNEVNTGLDQLLSDWSLFKKSGLFGTGPKGKDHPLFVKIAGLQIPLLLAGRFEGSTQEIKQSITDYMNGWRYEQGIIYEKGETFERYLRRVIKLILDLQKKRIPS